MSVMMVQTKCKLNDTKLFLKLFHIQGKEIGNSKYYEKTRKLEKWQSGISPEYWRYKGNEDSRLNAIECLKTDYVRERSTEFLLQEYNSS